MNPDAPVTTTGTPAIYPDRTMAGDNRPLLRLPKKVGHRWFATRRDGHAGTGGRIAGPPNPPRNDEPSAIGEAASVEEAASLFPLSKRSGEAPAIACTCKSR